MNQRSNFSPKTILLAVGLVALWLGVTPLALFAEDTAINEPAQQITLPPLADTFINSRQATTNFGLDKTIFVSYGGVAAPVENQTLLRFDLSSLPTGAIVLAAELRLHQTASTGNLRLNIERALSPWDETIVTWATRPKTEVLYSAFLPSLAGNGYISFSVPTLVKDWLYQPTLYPNYGILLRANPLVTGERAFTSREVGSNLAELVIDYRVPPQTITIPYDQATINLDADCTRSEYTNALSFDYIDMNGFVSNLFLKQDDRNLYVCVNGVLGFASGRYFAVNLDRDAEAEKYAQTEDYSLRIQALDGKTSSFTGTGDPNTPYSAISLLGWNAFAQTRPNGPETAEYAIPLGMLTTTCGQPFGLGVYHQSSADPSADQGWPQRLSPNSPATWVKATLTRNNCPIRVCLEQAEPCVPAPNAQLFKTPGGLPLALDANGMVIDRSQVIAQDQLWALTPVSPTQTNGIALPQASSRLFYTSGDPQRVGNGELRLVVSKQNPLWLQDLAVSSEWYVQGDPENEALLRQQIIKGANYLYDFSEGQFTLGRVTVQQSLEGWQDANLRLHTNNNFQPRAIIGGIVPTDTLDPGSPVITITYQPGKINMGSYWNRYGTPPGQPIIVDGAPVNPATLTDDWSIALGHELSHYLLFLFDTYIDPSGQVISGTTESCAGSAMGNAYDPLNQRFIFEQTDWDTNCGNTAAHFWQHGRHEWDTIQKFYPWSIKPTRVVTQPLAPPINLTNVIFISPTTPPGIPASSQVFDLLYQEGEKVSGEARAFLFRNGRLLEQGKPPKNSTQLTLLDGQVNDRLCVYDLNDHAEATDSPRHQFGCEPIQLGDSQLQMTKNVAWQPVTLLQQTGANQLQVTVSQTVEAGMVVMATLYPEYETAAVTIPLASGVGGISGTFTLTGSVPPAYVQLWVEESPGGALTRREVVVDRGTGGGGAYGPKRHYGGVFVVSSDGNASYENPAITELKEGESIAWQSMPGTPILPSRAEILGQSYRLDAYPISLVTGGEINIEFEEAANLGGAHATITDTTDTAIYFWDGVVWIRLSTQIGEPSHPIHGDGTSFAHSQTPEGVKLATSASRGVGVYAVLRRSESTIYLPVVQR